MSEPDIGTELPKLAMDASKRTQTLTTRANARLKRAEKKIQMEEAAIVKEKQRRHTSPLFYCSDFGCTMKFTTSGWLSKHEQSGKHVYTQTKTLATSVGDYVRKDRFDSMVPASTQVAM